jgi:MraZ protein
MEGRGAIEPTSSREAESSVAVVAPARPLFVGSFEHTLDDKNRVVLPAAFRAALAIGGFVGPLASHLGFWLRDEYEAVLARWDDGLALGLVAEQAYERFLALTFEVRPDGQGRFVVPPRARDFAGIDREVLVKGGRTRVELWALDRWDALFADDDDPDGSLRQAVRDLKL